MASPMPSQPNGGWNQNGQAMPPQQQQQFDDSGVQVRQVGLKVLYRFNKDDKFDCLARPSQLYTVQTIPIDQHTTIGVIDLRICIQAVIDCSPELPGQECDYTMYAHDYTEQDTPLVGQGPLSMALGTLHQELGEVKMVTGLLTRNRLAFLTGKNGDTLEVKMKFSETPRATRPQSQHHQASTPQQHQPQFSQAPQELTRQDSFSRHDSFSQQQRPFDRSMTPTGTNEWNSFIQQNPQLGQQPSFSRGPSPALSQGHQQPTHTRTNSFIQHPIPQDPARMAPTPAEAPSDAPGQASRPSSRASNRGAGRKKAPTGRPRGRPPNKTKAAKAAAANAGNTSGYEDGTEGEEGPIKKRAKVTQVDTVNSNPFGSEPDSLRVAASTAGSLRNFRPVGMTSDGPAPSHLQEVPRAPTPVPKGPVRGGAASKRQKKSAMSREVPQTSPQPLTTGPPSPNVPDHRSPELAMAQTPAFSEHSPGEIGSSPPVPRTTSFMVTSPAPSSPMLPPMPVDQAPPTDALEHDEMTDLIGDEHSQVAHATEGVPPPPASTHYNGGRKSRKTQANSVSMDTPVEALPEGSKELPRVHSYNEAEPTGLPPKTQYRFLAPLGPPAGHTKAPMMGPTPPPTTDATEKPTSPPESEPPHSRGGLAVPEPPSFPFERPVHLPAEKPASTSAGQEQSSPPPAQEAGQTGLAYPQPYFAPFPGSVPPAPEQFPQLPVLQGPVVPQVPVLSKKASAKPRSRAKAPPRPRKSLARSQSAGNLAIAPAPASEPAGPSGLSQSMVAQPEPPMADPPVSLRRAQSTGPLNIPVPASDPVGPTSGLSFPQPMPMPMPMPEAETELVQASIENGIPARPETSSSDAPLGKNLVKRTAIRQRLEEAVMKGQMPSYCCNCGAIETPTWRKIHCREFNGPAPRMTKEEYGSKPGDITMVEDLTPATDDGPGRHRVVKKSLHHDNDSAEDWKENLMCNPCGIWLVKSFGYRPQSLWDGDAERLGKPRKRKASETGPKPKRLRSKSTTQPPLTSEAIMPPTDGPAPTPHENEASGIVMEPSASQTPRGIPVEDNPEAADKQRPGTTHSSGSGTANSPIELEFDAALGTTKRLLFPSPRKDNSPKALSDLDVNIVQTSDFRRQEKATPGVTDKEIPSGLEGCVVLDDVETVGPTESVMEAHNDAEDHTLKPLEDWKDAAKDGAEHQDPNEMDVDMQDAHKELCDLDDLFGSPSPPRPSTPTASEVTGPIAAPTTPFKTPTRATPSNRPITRSVSRSLRSKGSMFDSPSAAFKRTPSRTPSKTPRDEYDLPGSAFKRTSPRNQILVDIDERLFDTPMSRAMNQMLSEPNFGVDDDEMDLVPSHWNSFTVFPGDSDPLPSSPPRRRATKSGDNFTDPPKDWAEFLSDIQQTQYDEFEGRK